MISISGAAHGGTSEQQHHEDDTAPVQAWVQGHESQLAMWLPQTHGWQQQSSSAQGRTASNFDIPRRYVAIQQADLNMTEKD